MKKTTALKPKCVLLDACIIIEAHGMGLWEALIEKAEIVVSSIVARDEALFYVKRQFTEAIDLQRLISEGKITEVAATASQLADLLALFDRSFIDGLDPGEAEALALITENAVGGAHYCTGDIPAIQALAMLGYSERGISMEKLLKQSGLQRHLRTQFTDRFFREKLEEGKENRITGRGLNTQRPEPPRGRRANKSSTGKSRSHT